MVAVCEPSEGMVAVLETTESCEAAAPPVPPPLPPPPELLQVEKSPQLLPPPQLAKVANATEANTHLKIRMFVT
jgi:hypothetical protein